MDEREGCLSAAMSGHVVKKKTIELATSKSGAFNLSNGRFYRWKQKNDIVFKREQGEKQVANFAAAQIWKKDEVRQIMESFEPLNIFNANEMGLYYRGFPD